MRLHENETLFRQAVTATAAQLNIPEIFIEKDYWVTYALPFIMKFTETKPTNNPGLSDDNYC